MRVVTDIDILSAHLQDQSGLKGSASGVARPRDAADVVEFVRESAALKRPLLPVGCQTATSGAASPMGDVVLDLRPMAGVVDIDPARGLAEVLPGTITATVKAAVEAAGLYYPPDPTSEHECTIGGNVASNASGARTFRWGSTDRWVHGLEVVTGTGELLRLLRPAADKNTAGYGPLQDPVSLLVGSEGTLGVVTRVWLRLIPHPGPFVAFLLFTRSLRGALEAAVALRLGTLPLHPRCVELFDAAALGLLAAHRKQPAIPSAAQAALYLELDSRDRDLERLVADELSLLDGYGVLADDTLVAQTAAEVAWIRELRHHIPETCNQIAAQFHAAGGLKVSADFAVPPQHLLEIMDVVERSRTDAGVDLMVRYGHVGNAHPHIFMRGRDAGEVLKLRGVVRSWCDRVAQLRGTVAAEHGIGKTKRDLLRHVCQPVVLEAMRSLKRTFDPVGIMARGNIFEPEESPGRS